MWLVTVLSPGFLKRTFRNNLCGWHYFWAEWPHEVVTSAVGSKLLESPSLSCTPDSSKRELCWSFRTYLQLRNTNITLLSHACTYTWLYTLSFLSESSKALDDILDECLNPFSLTSSPLGAVSLVSISLRLFVPSGEGMVSLVERAYAFGNSFLHPFLTLRFCLSSFQCLNHTKLLGRKGFIRANTGL